MTLSSLALCEGPRPSGRGGRLNARISEVLASADIQLLAERFSAPLLRRRDTIGTDKSALKVAKSGFIVCFYVIELNHNRGFFRGGGQGGATQRGSHLPKRSPRGHSHWGRASISLVPPARRRRGNEFWRTDVHGFSFGGAIKLP